MIRDVRYQSERISRIEKFADAMTHGFGLFFSIAGFFLLLFRAAFLEDKWVFLGFTLYGVSLVSAYLSSTIYHLYLFYHQVPNKTFRRFLLLFDHCSIFFMIAGTYTPILLVFMRTTLGWVLLGLVWFLTVAGMVYKIYYIGRFKRFSLFMYIAMGWLIVIPIKGMLLVLPEALFWWLLSGGCFYMVGILFFQKKFVPFNHAIWHVFVLIGSILHFIGILFYIQ